ncbi:uncharacterized protein Dwil_GK22206 [Drosophila willistoni]|uniref:Uncharacterized protein n=1 Tax=Drosophila willistoni TaxID=7260 RepID=B4MYE7_DROWI|nr:uncharacterized protein LOC6643403 [Drosophila willistoni]EDW77136.1 uncharacterized protein Dwil_GK22206 [Drosophila willistoni]
MGCSNTKSSTSIDDTKAPAALSPAPAPAPVSAKYDKKMDSARREYPASEAFTIPLDNELQSDVPLNETLRQPPKRIQQLMEEAASVEPLTLEELEDKQQKAEQRRQELMQQKLEIIQKNAQMLMRGHSTDGGAADQKEEQQE